MTIYACSSNEGKLREILLAARECGRTDVIIAPLPDLARIQPPEEIGATFEENSSAKALYYSRFTAEPVLADDSGLAVDALNGAPGIYSARYAGPEATDEDNNNLLLRDLGPEAQRHARFVCVLALAQSGRILTSARGVIEGEILLEPRGSGGFGYDPLFFYEPLGRTFAELTPEEKCQVSHRGRALRCLFSHPPEIPG
ncbi:MAG: RdgB/HAM1 family non-canonical purine NTP pyrophosphatase [Acidobacteriaceae bacterium]|nr:RdgB/HAM1 family non-canonical purine NTP pyrophosphatase [Acidobacteriaceae bacterium]